MCLIPLDKIKDDLSMEKYDTQIVFHVLFRFTTVECTILIVFFFFFHVPVIYSPNIYQEPSTVLGASS